MSTDDSGARGEAMTERDELNRQVALLCGWVRTEDYGGFLWVNKETGERSFTQLDYLGDERLWAPILERLGKLWWVPCWRIDYWELRHLPPLSSIDLTKPIANEPVPFIHTERRSGLLLSEAVLRLFVALRGAV